MKSAIVSVVGEYNWSPAIVGDLFLDNIDYKGLVFWFNVCKETERKYKEKKGAK